MRITESHHPIVIIGAGPSGLMMAAQLLRQGVQLLIIDSRLGPTTHSKALAVQARTVEIYRQMGLADPMLKDSAPAQGAQFFQQHQLTAELDFQDTGSGQTPFPHIYFYEQYKTERLLLNYLTQNCCPVYWNVTLIELQQSANQVSLQLKTDEHIDLLITCDWLIGADGAHSTVRRQLDIPFKGDTYPHEFFLADVQLGNTGLKPDYLQLHLERKGFAAFFPMPEAGNYRIIGSLPGGSPPAGDWQLQHVESHLDSVAGFNLQITECRWFTTYRLHHRMAEKFRLNRCFLIGDAAHIHSPVGGQGMNTGLQDAYNLAWKLAGVVQHTLAEHVLNTYTTERMQVAADLLQSTDRLFNLITSDNLFVKTFKSWLLPVILKWGWKKEDVRKAFFNRISQTSITYRNSRLSLHLSQATGVKAGDRLPYLKIFDEKKKQETDLHAWCSKTGFTLITFGPLQEDELFALARWITQSYGSSLNFFHLPPSVKNQQVFDRLEIKKGHIKALVVRPDMHIGLTADSADMEIISNYLKVFAGLTKQN